MSLLITYLLLHNHKKVSLFDFEIGKGFIIRVHNFTVSDKFEGIGFHAMDLLNLVFQLLDLLHLSEATTYCPGILHFQRELGPFKSLKRNFHL